VITFVAGFVALVVCLRAFFHPSARRAGVAVAVVVLLAIAVIAGPSGLVLTKVIGRLALPMGLVWVAVVVVTAWHIARRHVVAARWSGAAVVVLTLLGNDPLGQWLMQRLEAPYQADPFAEAAFDVVIVLGGGASGAPHAHYELSPSGDRVLLGARLWHAKSTPLLIATGTKIAGFQDQFDNLLATRTIWRDLGVDDDAIVVIDDTRTTGEEAAACAKLVRDRGFKRVGVVSSAWHLRRAMRLFAREDFGGAVVVPLAADHRGAPTWEGFFSVVPVGQGAWLQQKAVWELLGAATAR